jgi:chromosome segregation ATPase
MQGTVSEKAAQKAQDAQAIEALRAEVRAREQQLESTQQRLSEQEAAHQQHVKALQAKADGSNTAATREVGKLQCEVETLTGRLERLQKVRALCTVAALSTVQYGGPGGAVHCGSAEHCAVWRPWPARSPAQRVPASARALHAMPCGATPKACFRQPTALMQVIKDKNSELEKLQAQHGTAKQTANTAQAKLDKASKELADSRKNVDDLNNKLQQQQPAVKELADAKAKLGRSPIVNTEASLTEQASFAAIANRTMASHTCC